MGIYNRDYFRETPSSGWGLEGLTPMVKVLLAANIVVFVLQVLVTRQERLSPLEWMRKYNPQIDRVLRDKEDEGPEAFEAYLKKHPEWTRELPEEVELFARSPFTRRVSVVQEWLELDTRKVTEQGQVWRLVTCAFCHDRYAIWHILINMLALYWFGGTMEIMYGAREFLFFYFIGALVASLAFVGLDLYTGSRIPAVGASGAVMGVLMLYTMHFPTSTINIFWFFPLEMRWVMLFYVIYDLHPVLLALAGDEYFSGVAHAAHLGGLAFGFLYFRYHWELSGLWDKIAWRRAGASRRPRPRPIAAPLPRAESGLDDDMDRLDKVLEKISASGQASLTEDERAVLTSASERLKRRRGG